jgi:O-antigen/teichoic acid export membrane protein
MTWQLMFACLQGEGRFRAMNFLRVVATALSAFTLFVVLLTLHQSTVTWVLIILVGANLTASALGTVFALKASDRPDHDRALVSTRSLLRYGIAALPAASAPLETLSLDQAVVGLLLPRAQLGLYVVGAAFDNLPSILVSALGTIALPRIASERDPHARRRLMRRTGLVAIVLAAAVAVFAEAILSWLLPAAFGQSFTGAIPVTRVLIIAGFFLAVRRILIVFLQALGRPGRTAVGEAIALSILVALAVLLVPIFGLVGAGCALLVAAIFADTFLVISIFQVRVTADAAPTRPVVPD